MISLVFTRDAGQCKHRALVVHCNAFLVFLPRVSVRSLGGAPC